MKHEPYYLLANYAEVPKERQGGPLKVYWPSCITPYASLKLRDLPELERYLQILYTHSVLFVRRQPHPLLAYSASKAGQCSMYLC